MPRIHPHGWRELLDHAAPGAGESGGLPPARRRELETLARLAGGLDDRHTIYHGVHWTRLHERGAVFDDIDFIVVGPDGKLLLIEQAAGFLDERPGGLTRRQGGREIPVAARLAECRAAFEGRLRRALGAAAVPPVDVLFHCPDYTVRDGGSAGLPPERIVDATRRDEFCALVAGLVAPDPASGAAPTAPNDKLHRFLTDLLGLVPDANAVVGEAAALTTRLSGGLAEWARRIDCAPFRLRVIGTAGSGKTQLALAVFRDALAAGRRPLYVCYNRPLADHVAAIVKTHPAGDVDGMAVTYHQLADAIARNRGEAPDFARPDAFARLEAQLAAFVPDAAWRFDELIVDEGQDFEPAWADVLLRLLREDGRAWWLEDPMQNLYGRTPFRAPGWVELRAETNYRSPRAVLPLLEALAGRTVRSGCPIAGEAADILVYDDEASLIEQTKRAIGLCIAAGFRRDMIAVLSCRGREKSRLSRLSRLGPYALRNFSGRYDLLGAPILSEGEVVFDSVMRFKGRAAPCVVLTEADFETLDATACGRLFVGATRATLRLIVVAAHPIAASLVSLQTAGS